MHELINFIINILFGYTLLLVAAIGYQFTSGLVDRLKKTAQKAETQKAETPAIEHFPQFPRLPDPWDEEPEHTAPSCIVMKLPTHLIPLRLLPAAPELPTPTGKKRTTKKSTTKSTATTKTTTKNKKRA